MSDIGESSDFDSDHDLYRLLFDKETRLMLFDELREVIVLHDSLKRHEDIEAEVCEIIESLEMIADSIGFYLKFKPEKQQRRKERLESIANHLDGIYDQLKELDEPAIYYVLMNVWSNPSSHLEKFPPELLHHRADNTAFNIRIGGDVLKELSAYALSVRRAAKTLPKCIAYKPDAKPSEKCPGSPELGLAIQLENLFHKHGINFTTTNTGLAAKCLRAIYNLGGLDVDRVDYWLKQAKNRRN